MTTVACCPPEFVHLAHRMADAAGAIIRRYFRSGVAVDDKADASPVTRADREVEAALREMLAAERPEDGIVGEEYGVSRPDAPLTWVIDPIDGTKAFITGRPTFGTLIALLSDGEPILGVIDQPILRDRWLGARGGATLFNGAPCRVRSCPDIAGAVVSTTAQDLFTPADWQRYAALSGAARIRTFGGDCTAYGLLSCGFIDLVADPQMKLYDFAALVPVVRGAGGMITGWDGTPLVAVEGGANVLAVGDPALHAAAVRALSTAAKPA